MLAFLPLPVFTTPRPTFPRPAIPNNRSRSLPVASSVSPSSLPSLVPISPDNSCGFAALIGPSNSGKSTLLNRLAGQKVAIVTPKVQTTRCRVTAIATYDKTQVVYLDTPGIFTPSGRLSRAMVKSAWRSGAQADATVVVVDVAEMYHRAKRAGKKGLAVSEDVAAVLKGIADRKKKGMPEEDILVCANKIDAIPEDAHDLTQERMALVLHKNEIPDKNLLMLSAKQGQGVDDLVNWVTNKMPQGNWLYAPDELTDMPSRLIAAEITREKAFLVLRQEVPYEIAIESVRWKEIKQGEVLLEQNILVGRNSQKGIVVGAGGAVIKKIGILSRKEMEHAFDCIVHLKLKVKVNAKWKDDRSHYDPWGLDYNA